MRYLIQTGLFTDHCPPLNQASLVEGHWRDPYSGNWAKRISERIGIYGDWIDDQFGLWDGNYQGITSDFGEYEDFVSEDEQVQIILAEHRVDRVNRMLEVASKLSNEWRWMLDADPDHPVMTRFGLNTSSAKWYEGDVLLPIHDVCGRLWSAVRLDASGRYWFAKGGRRQGCMSILNPALGSDGLVHCGLVDDPFDKPIVICTDLSTAAALERIGVDAVYVTSFGYENLIPLCQILEQYMPRQKPKAGRPFNFRKNAGAIYVVGDSDRGAHVRPYESIAGRAAQILGAKLLVPSFPDGVVGKSFHDVVTLGLSHERLRPWAESQVSRAFNF